MLPNRAANVSVVIPCFRCSSTIERAVRSVAAQTMRPLEVLLVDDCSGDETIGLLHRLQDAYEAGWIRVLTTDVNSGPATARNIAWRDAKGEYIAFLDADEVWHPEKIATQYAWMQLNPAIAMSGHRIVTSQANRSFVGQPPSEDYSKPRRVTRLAMLSHNPFPTSSVMIRATVPYRMRELQRYSEDYLLWLQTALAGCDTFIINKSLATRFKGSYGEGGLSGNLWLMERGELENFRLLYELRLISIPEAAVAVTVSLLKFIRRAAITAVKRTIVLR